MLDDLVMSLSTELLGVGADDLATTIHDVLRRLGEAVEADRAYVLKANVEGRSEGEAFAEWWRPGIEQRNTPIPLLPVEAQRFWGRSLRTGEVVHVDDMDQIEEQCPEAATALRADGVLAIIFLPLLARDQTVGFIGFERRREQGGWAESTVSRMRTVGELLVMTVERCHADLERTATARALAARNAELERSNRELQQFASIVSHDLIQPLVVVQGFLEQLKLIAEEHPTKHDQATTFAAAAERATKRMRGLIDDVLAVARAGAPMGAAEPVDLSDVLDDVLADLEAVVDDTGAVVEVGPLPVIEGSETQLRQLFQNLVANALKYRRPGVEPVVRVASTAVGSLVEITVADNGPGIAPDERRAVFEMFARASSSGDAPGLGIGLAVCSRVVNTHNGTIRIDGNDDGGCTVRVRLPVTQPTA
jgi:signal transduction histidine kinase